jgi:KUP system potassium uptake protein
MRLLFLLFRGTGLSAIFRAAAAAGNHRQEDPPSMTRTPEAAPAMMPSEPIDLRAGHGQIGPWWAAAVTALGIVFGDIGTSPLYSFQVALHLTGHKYPLPIDVLGICSLIFWALVLIVAVKYVSVVMRADNDGEGGILALLSLIYNPAEKRGQRIPFLVLLGILGTALLYGDGVITPAISVLSAMEGLKVAEPGFGHWVLPTTVLILLALFMVQRRGTAAIGRFFGPIMALWFVGIGLLGLSAIMASPGILYALEPWQGIRFLTNDPGVSFVVFGAVFLALTGAEALYADMGHVGAPAIRRAWFGLVMPALVLNYFGQGALLLNHPEAADNPFYKLAPGWALVPLIGLAAAATIIASQALISGVFSLTRQAIMMRLCPRMSVIPTSSRAYGQIYIAPVNWALMLGTLFVVLTFRTSDSLASAYGIAVSGTMLITTILLDRAMRDYWRLPSLVCSLVTLVFAAIDVTFLAANSVKILEGGWLPLVIGAIIAFAMIAWLRGNGLVRQRMTESSMPFETFLDQLDSMLVARLPGCAVFLTQISDTVSPMLLRYVAANKVLHKNIILLTILPTRRPRVPAAERLTIHALDQGFHRVIISVGFMQRVDVPLAIRACARLGLEFCAEDPYYFIAHESVMRKVHNSGLPAPLWVAFVFMHRLAMRASDYLHLPPKRVLEVGFRVEI